MLPYYSRRLLKSLKIALLLTFSVFILLFCRISLGPDIAVQRFPAQKLPLYKCPCNNVSSTNTIAPQFIFRNLTEHRALVLVESTYSRHGRLLQQIITASKYPFTVETFSKNLPLLTTSLRGRYTIIVIENYYKYLNMAKWNRKLLDKYCADYKVPIISFLFTRPNATYNRMKIKGSNLYFWQSQTVVSLKMVNSSIHRISRVGTERLNINTQDWVLFEESSTYTTVISAKDASGRYRAAVLHDKGEEDNVERILFGHNVTDWMIKMTFFDVLWYTTCGHIGWGLERYLQIDIDDIFVGARGTRMVESDVRALLESQKRLRHYISNFTYMLGFSGSYFHNGDDNEDRGDEHLVELAEHFVWFPHMWRHNHAHEHNYTYLQATMIQNYMFAKNMRLPVKYPYAIAPQHDGVYPVHVDLYNAWRKVWKVEVTATEEYPHFKPASGRRGFVYMNISVLPRQTCGLYTHTQFFHNYPGGLSKLSNLIYGGELFFTVLFNPISIFMTHQQNFAHDRLGSYTFDNLVRFISCWTNIKLRWQNPVQSSRMYFSLMPHEKEPIWSNPCKDPRHKAILPPSLNCTTLTFPNTIIVGPQKTGTSALAMFLSLHPNVSANELIPESFEELQFFGGPNYHKGIEWYSRKFVHSQIIFEKSATYFDNVNAAQQAYALVPDAKIVIILHDPAKRAYSWYQHMLAHNETSVVLAGNMESVLDSESFQLKKIRQRCISGGRYIHHIDRWLEFYPLSSLILIDGEKLRGDPVTVLTELTEKLGLPYFNFESALRFSPSKGFFCKVHNGKTRCLGRGKGRAYPAMSPGLLSRLNGIFESDNIALHRFLVKNRLPVPQWLHSLETNV